MENRHCERCGAQWVVEIEHWRGEGLFSTHRWTTERVVQGTPCDCARRAEEEEEKREEEAAAQRAKEAAELYCHVTSYGRKLSQTTPVRLRYFDGDWTSPQPLKECCRNRKQFWLLWGQLYQVSTKDRTAVKIDSGAEYVNGELLVADSSILF